MEDKRIAVRKGMVSSLPQLLVAHSLCIRGITGSVQQISPASRGTKRSCVSNAVLLFNVIYISNAIAQGREDTV